jgi:hypothetical protein
MPDAQIDDVQRLVATLSRWTSAKASRLVEATGVDQGTLSRYLNFRPRASIGLAKTHALLLAMGWGALGPVASKVHRWRIDRDADVDWVFGSLLGGEATLSAVFPGMEAAEKLDHMDLLVGRYRQAWLVVSQASHGSDALSPSGDLLERLLQSGGSLCRRGADYVLKEESHFGEIDGGDISPARLEVLLTGSTTEVVRVSASVAKAVNEALDTWLTPALLEQLVGDGMIRMARTDPKGLAAVLEAAFDEGDKRNRDGQEPPAAVRAWNRGRAVQIVNEIASRRYTLDWPPDHDATQAQVDHHRPSKDVPRKSRA